MSASSSEGFLNDLCRKPILLEALLVLATLLLYWPVANHEFLAYDDNPYVVNNIHVRTGLRLGNVVWAFTAFCEGNWHPLTWISHMVDSQLFGVNSGAHHTVNIVLHAANVLLLFWLLKRATAGAWRSFLVAALFDVHPLNVETVAWVAQRKSLLSTLFWLLTIAAYGWYSRQPSGKRYLVVVAGFSLALMSKPMAVSLPIVLLLLDYWPLQRCEHLPFGRRWAHLLFEKLPLFLMSAAISAVTMVAQRSGGAVADSTALPLSARLENAVVSYLTYVGKTVWPAKLSVFYPHPEQSLPRSDVIAAAFILVSITIATVYFHRARYLVLGWFVFVITLIPVIGIVQVGHQAMADRYAYVPCIGIFIMVIWGLSDLVSAAAVLQRISVVAGLGVILSFAVATNRYLPYWQNGVRLFTHAAILAGRPDPVIEEARADALLLTGRYDEAYQHFAETCILSPGYALCHYNMAEILFHRHQLQDALLQYQIAATLTNRRDLVLSCFINSGEILMELGDFAMAGTRITAALQIDPENKAALDLRERVLAQRRGGSR